MSSYQRWRSVRCQLFFTNKRDSEVSRLNVVVCLLQDIGRNIYTLRDVVDEIRDKPTRRSLAFLPYQLIFREPRPELITLGKLEPEGVTLGKLDPEHTTDAVSCVGISLCIWVLVFSTCLCDVQDVRLCDMSGVLGLFLSDGVLQKDGGLPESVGHRHQGPGSDLPAGAGARRLTAPEEGARGQGAPTGGAGTRRRPYLSSVTGDLWRVTPPPSDHVFCFRCIFRAPSATQRLLSTLQGSTSPPR